MLLFLIDKNHCDLGPTIIFLGLFVKFPSISTSLDISGRQRAVRMVRTVDDPFLTLTYVKKHYVISELEPLCYPSLPTAWHILLLLRLCQVSLFCVYHTFVKSWNTGFFFFFLVILFSRLYKLLLPCKRVEQLSQPPKRMEF